MTRVQPPATPPGIDPLEERRQRAREAFWDGAATEVMADAVRHGLQACIETATRVHLDTILISKIARAAEIGPGDARRALEVFCAELGFEVQR